MVWITSVRRAERWQQRAPPAAVCTPHSTSLSRAASPSISHAFVPDAQCQAWHPSLVVAPVQGKDQRAVTRRTTPHELQMYMTLHRPSWWCFGSSDIILKDPRTIHGKFGLNWLTGFREDYNMKSIPQRMPSGSISSHDPSGQVSLTLMMGKQIF